MLNSMLNWVYIRRKINTWKREQETNNRTKHKAHRDWFDVGYNELILRWLLFLIQPPLVRSNC